MFAQRFRYVQSCLLAKIWYMAQIVLLTTVHAQHITTICTWFIWQWAIFRIPVTTLRRPKEEGGWGFPDTISAKCRTLLYNRIKMMGESDRTVLAEPMRNWDLTHTLANSPNLARIPPQLVHIRQYAMDMAYVLPFTAADTRKTFKNVYMTCLCAWMKLNTALLNYG